VQFVDRNNSLQRPLFLALSEPLSALSPYSNETTLFGSPDFAGQPVHEEFDLGNFGDNRQSPRSLLPHTVELQRFFAPNLRRKRFPQLDLRNFK
jgi:hypothetical protein